MFENLLFGFGLIFSEMNFLIMVLGVLVGIFVGMTPGLNVTTGVALALPLTYSMSPPTALIFLCAIYMASEYGGSISAILINTPGTGAAVATVFDGYPLAKKGLAGKALSTSVVSSTIGGIIGTLILIFLAVPLSNAALNFSAAEYAALAFLGLSVVVSLIRENMLKGAISALLGLLISTAGVDVFSGYSRFSFGSAYLMNGIPLVPAMVGLFAVAEILRIVEGFGLTSGILKVTSSQLLTLKELRKLMPTIFKSSAIGTGIGIIPGAGAAIASLIAYTQAKNSSKTPEAFGEGCLEGVAAPESANNASVGGALIPLLTFGIPGSAATAILVGALIMHGVTPGPQLFEKNIDVVYGLFASQLVVCPLMLLVGLVGSKLFPKLLGFSKSTILATILAIIVLGTYSLNTDILDVWVMFAFGLLGYFFGRIGIPVPPMVLAMILGFIFEGNFRRALVLSEGSYMIFFTRPISLLILSASVLFIVLGLRKPKQHRIKS